MFVPVTNWLVVEMTFPVYGKKIMFQTTNQILMGYTGYTFSSLIYLFKMVIFYSFLYVYQLLTLRSIRSMTISGTDSLEVPTIYKAYVSGQNLH